MTRNIQIIDRADNATFSIFQATQEEFATIFPDGRDMEIVEDLIARAGECCAVRLLSAIWERPVLKSEAQGIHGTLFYDYAELREIFPDSMREVDWPATAINEAQRSLFQSKK